MPRAASVRDRILLAAAVMLGALAGCGEGEAPDDAAPLHPPDIAFVKPAAQALAGAHIPTLDPGTLNTAEIAKVLGTRPLCSFRYTSTGRPVMAAGLGPDGKPEAGVIKLNGSLVPLQPAPAATGLAPGGLVLQDGPVRLQVEPVQSREIGLEPVEADMVFEIGEMLRVGYGGYMECRPAP